MDKSRLFENTAKAERRGRLIAIILLFSIIGLLILSLFWFRTSYLAKQTRDERDKLQHETIKLTKTNNKFFNARYFNLLQAGDVPGAALYPLNSLTKFFARNPKESDPQDFIRWHNEEKNLHRLRIGSCLSQYHDVLPKQAMILPHERVASVVYSPDNRFLLSTGNRASGGNSVRLWDIAGPNASEVVSFTKGLNGERVLSAVFTPDGKHVVVGLMGSEKNPPKLLVWQVAAGNRKASLADTVFLDGSVEFLSTVAAPYPQTGRILSVHMTRSPNPPRFKLHIRTWAVDESGKLTPSDSGTVEKMAGAESKVTAGAVSADGSRLALAWNYKSSEPSDQTDFPSGKEKGSKFPELNDQRFETATKVKVWNLDKLSEPPRQLQVEEKSKKTDTQATTSITTLAFRPPDGRLLLAFGELKPKTLLFDLNHEAGGGQDLRPFSSIVNQDPNSAFHYSVMSFSPDGRLIVGSRSDGKTDIFETAKLNGTTGKVLSFAELNQRSKVFHLAFSPDGRFLTTSSRDKTAKSLDLATGHHWTLPHLGTVSGAAYSSDCKRMATWSWSSGLIHLWQLSDHGHHFLVPLPPDGSSARETHVDVHRSTNRAAVILPGGELLLRHISGHHDEQTPKAIEQESRTLRVRFSPTGDKLVTIHEPMLTREYPPLFYVAVRNVSDELKLSEAQIIKDRELPVIELASLSEDEKQLVIAGYLETNNVKRWCAQIWKYDANAKQWKKQHSFTHRNTTESILHAAFDQHGKRLVTCSSSDNAIVWYLASKQPPFRCENVHTADVVFASFGRGDHQDKLVTASSDETAVLWQLDAEAPKEESITIWRHDRPVRLCTFDPSGNLIATVTDHGSASLYDAGSKSFVGRLALSKGITAAEFSDKSDKLTLIHHSVPVLNSTAYRSAFNDDEDQLRAKVHIHHWDLQPYRNDPVIKQVKKYFYLTSMRTFDDNDDLASLYAGLDAKARADEVVKSWKQLAAGQTKLPVGETYAPYEAKWHQHQARESKHAGNWYGSVYHLTQMLGDASKEDKSTVMMQRCLALMKGVAASGNSGWRNEAWQAYAYAVKNGNEKQMTEFVMKGRMLGWRRLTLDYHDLTFNHVMALVTANKFDAATEFARANKMPDGYVHRVIAYHLIEKIIRSTQNGQLKEAVKLSDLLWVFDPYLIVDPEAYLKPAPASKTKYFTGALTKSDERDRVRSECYRKVHEVELVAGHRYVINLTGTYDTYLRVEDELQVSLASNDDGGTNLNSQIMFAPVVTGRYRVIVTSFHPGETGTYSLTIRPEGDVQLPRVAAAAN